MTDMLEKVIKILAEYTEADVSSITEESRLVADLGLSSLDVINVVVAFEDEFGIEIPDQIIKDLTTVGDIVRYLA
jgi:acyl carrier protein